MGMEISESTSAVLIRVSRPIGLTIALDSNLELSKVLKRKGIVVAQF